MLPNLHIGNEPIFWADKLKYLGVYFDSGKMIKIDILPMMRKFYGSANSILCHSKYVSELTKLSLFESFALPVLMYGLDVLFLGPVEMRKLNVCWNSIYRRIFNFHRWESVKVLQLMCERLDLTHILDKIKLKFYHRLYRCDSDVLQYCLSISKYSKNVINLFNKYDACVGDVVNIDVIFCKFADSCRLKCVG